MTGKRRHIVLQGWLILQMWKSSQNSILMTQEQWPWIGRAKVEQRSHGNANIKLSQYGWILSMSRIVIVVKFYCKHHIIFTRRSDSHLTLNQIIETCSHFLHPDGKLIICIITVYFRKLAGQLGISVKLDYCMHIIII